MADTTTALRGSSAPADLMDESLVTQSDQVTQAKRPRVVIGGDVSGSALVDPINTEPTASPYSVPVLGMGLVDESPPGNYVRGELRPMSVTAEGRLRVSTIPGAIFPDYYGEDVVEFFSLSQGGNPWKDIL